MARAERRFIMLLPIAFGLTVLSFVLATAFAEYRARDIEADARSVSAIAVPALYHLSRARTNLRALEVHLDDYVHRVARGASRDPEDAIAKFRDARERFEREWAAYLTYAPYPGERALWATIMATWAATSSSAEKVLSELQAQNVQGAEDRLENETKPLIDRLDDGLVQAVELNGRNVASRAEAISASAASSRRLILTLDLVSALLAIAAGVVVVTATRRHLRVLELRMSELEHFAGRVAHDIRSPLSSVGLALDLARRGSLNETRTHAMLERGTRTLQRVGQLVDGLLVFARAGAPPADGERANVTEVLEGVMEEMLPAAEEKEIELRVEHLDPSTVACSAGVLTSILSNLVGNAIKYMGNAPVRSVSIRALDQGATLRIEIQDTGPGIPKELRERIFDPYARAADAAIPGLGLGLATVRRLVEAHDGAVGVESSERGSLFWVELPKVSPASASSPLRQNT